MSVAQGKTRVQCHLEHLTPNGAHGMHVHEYGDMRRACTSTGAHYNPTGRSHGGVHGQERHAGDMGNVRADAQGRCTATTDVDVSLDELFGRAVVLHASRDDLGRGSFEDSTTSGHSGARMACGVIGVSGGSHP
jgi:Cu-Zn family superoxide dismutase